MKIDAKKKATRRVAAIVVAGSVVAGSATAVAATRAGTTAASTTTTAHVTTAAATPGLGSRPGGGPGGPGPGGGLTVTRVSGQTILAKDGRGRTITVRVGTGTTYSAAGARATLSAVRAGEQIAVQAAGAAAGVPTTATTLTATRVTILLPQVMGQVTAVNRGSLTVKGVNGTTVTVTTTVATRYVKPSGARVAATALKRGVAILAEGTLSGNGKTLTARRVTIGVSTSGPAAGPGGGTPPSGSSGAPPAGTPVPSS